MRPEVLANDIRSTGFFNNKAKSIVGAAKRVVTSSAARSRAPWKRCSPFPARRARRPTWCSVRPTGSPPGVVVDTHVPRISQRLDLTKNTDPVKIEQDLVKIIPQDRWIKFTHQIILHGRALCIARCPNAPSATSIRSVTLRTKRPSAVAPPVPDTLAFTNFLQLLYSGALRATLIEVGGKQK